MNVFIGAGNVTADPDVKESSSGKKVAKFTLAIQRRFNREQADFIRCTAFGKTAEFIEKYVAKGTRLNVEGSVQTGSYDDKDGKKVYTTDIIVNNVEFGSSKKDNASASSSAADDALFGEPVAPSGGNRSRTTTDYDDFMSVTDDLNDELPFD